MINYNNYYFFFKKTYKQIAYKFGRKNPIAIPDMYVLTLGSKRQKKILHWQYILFYQRTF